VEPHVNALYMEIVTTLGKCVTYFIILELLQTHNTFQLLLLRRRKRGLVYCNKILLLINKSWQVVFYLGMDMLDTCFANAKINCHKCLCSLILEKEMKQHA
jgi:hypothetical protein